MTEVSADAIARLAQYWGRAQIMRSLFKDLIAEHEGIESVLARGYGLRLETYLSFWMAGLFVTVEGFNRLKLKDTRVQRLFKRHVSDLKELRHETYHFTVDRSKGRKAARAINWAEKLHVALGNFLEQYEDVDAIAR